MSRVRLGAGNFLLLPWVLFFSVVLFSGGYRYYVASFQLWTIGAGLLFMTVAFLYGLLVPANGHDLAGHECGDPEHIHGGCCPSHGADPGWRGLLSIRKGLLHFVPLFLFLAAGPRTLSTQVVQAKDPFMGMDAGAPLENDAELPDLDRFDIGSFEDTDIGKLYADQKYRSGHHGVVVEGLVYRPSAGEIPPQLRTGGKRTFLLHFVMVCCAADCVPKVVLLEGVSGKEADEDTWVKLWGVTSRVGRRRDFVRLDVLKLETLAKPACPYLVP